VIDAAVALADQQGLEGLMMRNVAHRLRSEPVSLYRHVGTKEDLIDGMVGVAYGPARYVARVR
jgi:AcrR family transcriptional regulator